MLKYVSQFFLQMFPSIIATVVGAYIVNYHILPKASDGAGPNAAKASIASTPDPAKDVGAVDVTKTVSIAEEGGKPKPAATEKPVVEKAVPEKAAAEPKRSKATAKPSPVAEKQPAVTVSAAPADAPVNADDKRDANDIARAALDRLRSSEPPRVTVAATPPQQQIQVQPQPQATSPQVQQHMQPLPPAVLITAPSNGAMTTGIAPPSAPETQQPKQERARLLPPGDIPVAPPLDLRAPKRETSITDHVVAKAKSVFEAVIPR